MLSGDTEMGSAIGTPSGTNYFDIFLNLNMFIFTVLHKEETSTRRPLHDTIDWYRRLLFLPLHAGLGGSPGSASAGSTHTGNLASGLSALLAEMSLDNEVSVQPKLHMRGLKF